MEKILGINENTKTTVKTFIQIDVYMCFLFCCTCRNEMIDSDSVLCCSKCDQAFLAAKISTGTQNSLLGSSIENHSISRTPSNPSSVVASTEEFLPIISDQQISIRKDSRPSLPTIISTHEESLPMNRLPLTKDNLLQSSETINTNASNEKKIENDVQIITTKVYKLPLPSNKPKLIKSVPKQRLCAKSSENQLLVPTTLFQKKETTSLSNTSTSKRRRQKTSTRNEQSSNQSRQTSSRKEQYISTVQRTNLKAKNEQTKLYMPYLNIRYVPPTPPCSPSLSNFAEDTDQHECEVYFYRDTPDDV